MYRVTRHVVLNVLFRAAGIPALESVPESDFGSFQNSDVARGGADSDI